MLSFLRQEETETLMTQASAEPQVQKDGNETSATDEIKCPTTATRKQEVRNTSIMLGILFVAGLGMLFLMIKKSGPSAATAATAPTEGVAIETAISRLTGVGSQIFNRMDAIVRKFYEFTNMQQVAVNELAKNPFYAQQRIENLEEICKQGQTNSIFTEQARKLNLLSIMSAGAGRCCMINDKILYKGESIAGFQITEIGSNYVKLSMDNMETTLKLTE